METITSKTGVIYYNYDDDDFQYDENKKYYISSLRYKTYYVGDPRNKILVTWYVYYEVDKDEKINLLMKRQNILILLHRNSQTNKKIIMTNL